MEKEKDSKSDVRYRYENFGGIISSSKPPFLAFVDRNYMRELKLDESPAWQTEDEQIGILSAPTEVHFSITNRCSLGCSHCYMDGGLPDQGEFDTQTIKRALDVLAGMGVFHVAMGGGEALEHPDLIKIGEYARSIGLTPNLTTSGNLLTPEMAKKLKVFGQVNISVDGVDSYQKIYRKTDNISSVDRAFDILMEADISTGINCVLGRKNFENLEALFQYGVSKGINEIEFLRFKPSGRGKDIYYNEKTTYEQNIALTPKLSEYSDKYKIAAKIDCSFVPMYCYHKPPVEFLEGMATYGCEAGNVLLGVRSNGAVSGCSFLGDMGVSVFDLPGEFAQGKNLNFDKYRSWTERAPEPCLTCDYLRICKGGCHGVSEFVTGDYDDPDPDCPYVIAYKRENQTNK